MSPRLKRVSCKDGKVVFIKGVQENCINDFLEMNNIKSLKREEIDNTVVVQIPPAEEYPVPDHVWAWVK